MSENSNSNYDDNKPTSSIQATTFADDTTHTELQINSDPDLTKIINQDETAPLSDFLERPVLIHTIDWTDSTVATHIDPFALIFNDSVLQSKLDRFKLMRGELVLTFLVNGTPYHYGCLLAAYEPGVVSECFHADTNQYAISQLPHVKINPTLNTKLSLQIPILKQNYWFDLEHPSGVRNGIIHLYPLNPLAMANSATPEPVTISVFAHFTNVRLVLASSFGIATFTSLSSKGKISTKKKKGGDFKKFRRGPNGNWVGTAANDEYGKGPVSSVASAVANAASALKTIPIIGPMARATEIGASVASEIFSIFGFSRPNVIEDQTPVSLDYTSAMTHGIGGDNSVKLALDPKNEITVDTRPIGLDGTDQMSLDYIKSIPSYVKTITWQVGDAEGSSLGEVPVTPMLYSSGVITSGEAIFPTATCFLGEAFSYWTGSIKFKIQIVSSAFHRGRLRVTWKPKDTATVGGYNETISEVIDIQDDKDHEIVIGFGQQAQYRKCARVEKGDTVVGNDYVNGFLLFSVQNTLGSPLSTEGIAINIWMCGDTDLTYSAPRPIQNTITFRDLVLTSGIVDHDAKEVDTVQMFDAGDREALDSIHMGETVSSLRVLLKRYNYYGLSPSAMDAMNAANDGKWMNVIYSIPHFPQGFGAPENNSDNYTWSKSDAGNRINFFHPTYLNFFSKGFLGYRGGVRWKIATNDYTAISLYLDNVATGAQSNQASKIEHKVFRFPTAPGDRIAMLSGSNPVLHGTSFSPSEYDAAIFKSDIQFSNYGVEVYKSSENYAIEVESPDYNPLLYHCLERGAASTMENYDCLAVHKTLNTPGNVDGRYGCAQRDSLYCAAGEDFSFIFFKGAPSYNVQDAGTVVGPTNAQSYVPAAFTISESYSN